MRDIYCKYQTFYVAKTCYSVIKDFSRQAYETEIEKGLFFSDDRAGKEQTLAEMLLLDKCISPIGV